MTIDPRDDSQAIKNLLYRYAELIDAGDFDGVGALFEHATIDWGGAETTGSAAATSQFEHFTRRYEDGTPRTVHIVTNAIVDVADDKATARSRYTVMQATESLMLQPIIAGRYKDRFERVEGTWRFSHRRYIIDLTGDLRQHLL